MGTTYRPEETSVKWSFSVGRLFGINLRVHGTFLLLLAWLGIGAFTRTHSAERALSSVIFTLIVFLIVVLHELSHALTARQFGIKTKDIILLPIGGMARMERMPEKPAQEALVAFAGPALNLVIAMILGVGMVVAGVPLHVVNPEAASWQAMLANLLWVNVGLAVFNLIPAFPMDGGRVLRALLALRGDYVWATRMAARVGQVIAVGFGLFGFFYNPMLVLIAIFVWLGANAEASMVETRAALRGIPVHWAMTQDVPALAPGDSLESAARAHLARGQNDFPVLDESGVLVGVLTRNALIRGLSELGANAPVRGAMHETFVTADPYEMLDSALRRLQECECRVLPVVRDGRVVGMISFDKIGELVALQSAVRNGHDRVTHDGAGSRLEESLGR